MMAFFVGFCFQRVLIGKETMTDDWQLLQQYTRDRSESAFGELVARHIDLVYSAALRVARSDRHLAQDVTQMVFIDLARKAWSLPGDVLLAGWLYRHACYTAAKAVRTERRRKTREQTAMEMRALDDNTEPRWETIAPRLDEGLKQLSGPDRDAILLRFLKRQDLRAVGAALGISEDAAQKRVSRALEKLRAILSRRGVALTASGLASVLTTEAVTAAPAGLAVSATVASLAAAAGTGSALTLLKFMAATKLKTGVISAIVVASVVMPLVVQHQAQAILTGQHEALRQRASQLAGLQAENERLANLVAQGKSSRAVPDEEFTEVLRLRGAVGRMRAEARESTQPPGAPMSRNDMLASMAKEYSERVSRIKQLLEANPSEKIPELQFLTDEDWLFLANKRTLETEEGRSRAMSTARQMAEENFVGDTLRPALQKYARDHDGQFPGDLDRLRSYLKSKIDETVLRRWTVLPKRNLVGPLQAQLREDWFITQKAPVNAALDQRILCGLNEVHSFADGPPSFWEVVR